MDTIQGRTANILVIEAPPRHGKSEYTSKYLPAWFEGRFPDKRVALVSYEANFARSWGRKARGVLAEFGPEYFGVSVSDAQNAAIDWEVDEYGGGMITAGIGGPLTGRGADLLVIDDSLKNDEEALSEKVRENQWEWWQSTASTRLEPGGVVVIIGTRWHKQDLIGRLLDSPDHDVRLVHLPAIAEEDDQLGRAPGDPLWPARWPLEALEKRQRELDTYWWCSLYQQRPTKHGRSKWPDTYFGDRLWCPEDDWPEKFELSVVTCDPSSGKEGRAFPAIAFLGMVAGTFYVDLIMERRPEEEIAGRVLDFCDQYSPYAVGVESNYGNAVGGYITIQSRMRGTNPPRLKRIHNTENKDLVRIPRLGPLLRDGRLRFRLTAGSRIAVQQLQEFPLSDFKDGPDVIEMGVRLLHNLLQSGEAVVESEEHAT